MMFYGNIINLLLWILILILQLLLNRIIIANDDWFLNFLNWFATLLLLLLLFKAGVFFILLYTFTVFILYFKFDFFKRNCIYFLNFLNNRNKKFYYFANIFIVIFTIFDDVNWKIINKNVKNKNLSNCLL